MDQYNFLYGNDNSYYSVYGSFGEHSGMAMAVLRPDFVERLRFVADRLGTRREAAGVAGVSLDAVIRYLRGDNQPSFMAISRMCLAARVSMQWLATGSGEPDIVAANGNDISQGIPIIGMAESDQINWYAPVPWTMQTTLDLPDPKAFASVVHGLGLVPEGLQPGFLCVCSPMLKPVQGDIVHLRRQDGLCTLKAFEREDGEWLVLRGYAEPDARGLQRPYEDRVKRSHIVEIAPVVFVRRKV